MPAHGVALAAGLVVLATLPPADTFAVLLAPRGWLVLRGASATGPRVGSNACPRARAPLRTRMQVQTEEDAKGIAPPAIKQDVVCVEGSSGPVCTIVDEDAPKELTSGEYWFPRVLFLGCCIAYGTNFALGRSMNEALDPSVVSGLRFSLAALTLSPFLRDMKRELIKDSVLMSLFIAAGYIGQSLSLQTIEAGKAGFICSLSVIVCPILETVFDNKKVSAGLIAAVLLSVSGVATLELTGDSAPAIGDLFALAQPIGFGTGYYLTEKQMRENPTMTLPITAVQTAVVSVCALTWMVGAGLQSGHLTDGTLFANLWSFKVAGALLWTGVITTALTRLGETKALSGISSSEASVLMTTEPIWAAVWGSVLMGEVVGPSAYTGGGLIMAACAANIIDPVKARDFVVEGTATIYRQGSAALQRLGSMRDPESD